MLIYKEASQKWIINDLPNFGGNTPNLIVGSYDNATAGVNGGKVGFYKIDRSSHSVTKLEEYTRFAKVKDVVYI
ncbi:MAG: hypothetical protein MR298_10385 [Odoribacter sp.]|nr:hypothetical protein [Odoribacter sp.]